MGDYKVGYGKTPEHSRFQPGKSGNPRGRPLRTPDPLGEVVQGVLETPIQYRENGRSKTAPWTEIRLNILLKKALAGDVKAADTLFEERKHALRHGQADTIQIEVVDWLPEFGGQTAEQKTAAASGAVKARQPKPARKARAAGSADSLGEPQCEGG